MLVRSATVLVVAAVLAAGCGSHQRVVGFEDPGGAVDAGGAFRPPVLVRGLLDPADEMQDPSLSPDELEIYFASLKDGTYDIWTSTRSASGQPWNRAVLVPELSTPNDDLEPDLSYDGLTLYLSSDRPGVSPGFRVWVARRQSRSERWGVPQLVDLGETSADRGPTVEARGLVMVLASERGSGDMDLFMSTRTTAVAAWAEPRSLGEINSAVFDWDAGLFHDGLGLVFGSRRDGDRTTSDLFQTTRVSDGDTFDTPRALDALNSPMSEGDPWLSNDGLHIVFSSDRNGVSQLYESWR
jgi:Tol biopolymer transport system component